MSFDSGAVAAVIKTKLEGLSGMGSVQIGAPESVGTRVGSYVTLGSQSTGRKTTGTTERQTRFFVMFLYRVEGAETTAETTLMALVDAFMVALHADLTLGGTCADLEVNSLAADEPEYQARAGKEFREYPVIVAAKQYGTYAVNP